MKCMQRTHWAWSFLFVLLSSPLAVSQTYYGSVVGTVTDSSGSVVTGTNIALTNLGTVERKTLQTDQHGDFQFVNVPPGDYMLDMEGAGYKHFRRDSFQVQVQSVVRINAVMQVGEVSQVVDVTAQTPLLDSDTSSLGQVIEGRAVEQMPLNGRNVMNLIALAPGVVPQGQTSGNPATNNVNGWGNYQIGGGIANQSAEYIDGAPLNVNYVHMLALVPAQDSVQEFRVLTNSLGPEFGDTSGGIVTLLTRSGTNAFHGGGYEFLRNKVLNANTFFGNEFAQPRAAFTQNQYGVNFGGPIRRDKTFFFFNWENFALRQGNTYVSTVPTAAERGGDFSASGSPVYDALTTCGLPGTPDCAQGQSTRQQFAGNVVPQDRISPTAAALLKYLWPLPNASGVSNNFSTTYGSGTNSKQFNGRVDQDLSEKQRLFGRYTFWSSTSPPVDPFNEGNGLGSSFQTNQAVLGDSYAFSPSTVGDLRVAFLRFLFNYTPQSFQVDQTKFGLPESYNAQEPLRNNPDPCVAGYSDFCNQNMAVIVLNTNNSYSIMPSVTKILGRHTLKAGAEIRRMEFNFAQTTTASGFYVFDNLMTSVDPTAPGNTGFGLASFLLGYGSSGSISQPTLTAGRQYYQGYYLGDTFQFNQRLTLNYGVRWELPGPWTERHDREVVFLPNQASPLAGATGLPLMGNLALVNSAAYPSRGSQQSHWRLFAPRLGFAYRPNNKSVIRAGYGMFFVPDDASFNDAPWTSPINAASTAWLTSLNGGATPSATLSSPFPSGISQPVGRNPNFQNTLYGSTMYLPVPRGSYGYTQQWNLDFEHDLTHSAMFGLAYAGSKGTHLPGNSQNINQLPDQDLAQGTQLSQPVANPFYGLVPNGTILSPQTVVQSQLLLPYPQFSGVFSAEPFNRVSAYHSLQAKLEARTNSGGTLLVAYTWAKLITNGDSLTAWLEDGGCGCAAQIQDNDNLRGERSLSQSDVPQRAVVSYVLDLPVGRGKRFLGTLPGPANQVLGGWGINGITTIQSGFPLAISAASNPLSQFGFGSLRPNVDGPNTGIRGSAQGRVNEWFNVDEFSQPDTFSVGNEPRLDSQLRSAGIANWDFAAFKGIALTEKIHLQFRAEFFNLFNRVQFAPPNTACCTLNNSQFGVVTSQANTPRLVQFALRAEF